MPASRPPPTVAELASAHGARFSFWCRPCPASAYWSGPELLAKVGDQETFEGLKRRTICPRCRMPVDGVFRMFDFSCTTDPAEWARLGLGAGGWGARQG